MHKRRFRRIPFDAEVTLTVGDLLWSGELLDVALRGASAGSDMPLPVPLGCRGELRITLPDTPIILDFEAELIYSGESRYGFRFLSEKLETLIHLRKLIELNSGDVEATRSELDEWLKQTS